MTEFAPDAVYIDLDADKSGSFTCTVEYDLVSVEHVAISFRVSFHDITVGFLSHDSILKNTQCILFEASLFTRRSKICICTAVIQLFCCFGIDRIGKAGYIINIIKINCIQIIDVGAFLDMIKSRSHLLVCIGHFSGSYHIPE